MKRGKKVNSAIWTAVILALNILQASSQQVHIENPPDVGATVSGAMGDGFSALSGQGYGYYAESNNSGGYFAQSNSFNGFLARTNNFSGFFADLNDGYGFYAQGNIQGAAYLDGKVYVSNRIGIGIEFPDCKLHIKQEGQNSNNGIRLVRSDNMNYWTTHINHLDDYVIWYNGTTSPNGGVRAWIKNEDASYNHVSDIRLKRDIVSLDNGLSKVMQLRPVTYQLASSPTAPFASMGFIAQEVEWVLPSLVSENDGFKGLNYAGFSVVAIRAIQEQQELIEILQADNIKLKKQIEAIQYLKSDHAEIRELIRQLRTQVEKTLEQ